jgi:hypothetical protein
MEAQDEYLIGLGFGTQVMTAGCVMRGNNAKIPSKKAICKAVQ